MNDNSPTSSAAGILYYYSVVKNLGYSKKNLQKLVMYQKLLLLNVIKL